MLQYKGILKDSQQNKDCTWNVTYSETSFKVQHKIITFYLDYHSDLKWFINRDEFEKIELIKENNATI